VNRGGRGNNLVKGTKRKIWGTRNKGRKEKEGNTLAFHNIMNGITPLIGVDKNDTRMPHPVQKGRNRPIWISLFTQTERVKERLTVREGSCRKGTQHWRRENIISDAACVGSGLRRKYGQRVLKWTCKGTGTKKLISDWPRILLEDSSEIERE